MTAAIVEEWRTFRHDEPGHRFENHYLRMRRQGSRGGAIARSVFGVALVCVGLAMLVFPGPGIIVTLFGLGLLGGQSRTLARGLDRVEPPLHRAGHAAKAWWRRARWPMRAAVIAATLVIGSAAALAMGRAVL